MKTITLLTKPISINQKYGIINGRNLLTKAYRDAKYDLALETRSQWTTEPLSVPLALNIMFYYGDNRKRDIDAYIKILLDAMEGVVYENDVLIEEMHVFKSVDKEEPRTVVHVLH